MTTSSPTLTGARVEPVVLGRYMLCDVIGEGGMARVHIGRVIGAGGFSRVVAIKRLHPQTAGDPEVSTTLIDEARLVSRIRHPNVVPTLDVVAIESELLLVMEYVHGISISQLQRIAQTKRETVPVALASRIIVDTLAGLGAAHEAKSERGRHLELVHRDVSPQNVLVDVSGMARIVDFGIAKAQGKLAMTRHGQIKGKLNYMAPEQLRGEEVDRRADLYGAGIVLWELVCGRRLFDRHRKDLPQLLLQNPVFRIEPPSKHRGAEAAALDAVIARALAPNAEDRFADADEMATALAAACPPATTKEVATFVEKLAAAHLEQRSFYIERAEQLSEIHDLPPSPSPSRERHPTGPPPRAMDAPAPAPAPERRSRMPLVALGVALLLTLALAMIVARSGPKAPAPGPEPVASVAPAAEVDAAIVEPVTIELPTASATPAARTTTRPRPRASARPAAPDCNPPYSIDARGIRIPRRECLGE